MTQRHKILVVVQNPSLACQLVTWLAPVTDELALVTTFAAAKVHLKTRPDLVITEVKLREYNGLHLALRTQAAGIPTIVIGMLDPVFERQAEQLGAAYMSAAALEADGLYALIQRLVEDASESASLPQWCEGVPTSNAGFVEGEIGTPPLGIVALGLAQRPFVIH
jgi:DNA-binding NtrC family response regulator